MPPADDTTATPCLFTTCVTTNAWREHCPPPSFHASGDRDPSHVKADPWGELQFQGMWLTCKSSPVKQVSSLFRDTGGFITLAAALILLYYGVLEPIRERFWAVLGHGGCSARGSYCCCSESSSKEAQVSGISEVCRLNPTLGFVPCAVGVLCGTALPMYHLCSAGELPLQGTPGSWSMQTALFPLPWAQCSSRAQQQREDI